MDANADALEECPRCAFQYHTKCMHTWLQNGKGCPQCRLSCGDNLNEYSFSLIGVTADEVMFCCPVVIDARRKYELPCDKIMDDILSLLVTLDMCIPRQLDID